ncbi:MAG: hypothetical protein ACOC5L_03015 [Halobacteriota archaeon]
MIMLTRNIDLSRWDKLSSWRLVYGRRKTGKTFFVKEFTEWDHYFFVRRDGMVIDEKNEILSYEAFFEIFKRELDKKSIVIDEFHRLPDEFLDYLHYLGTSGELTLISSMLWSINQLFEPGSPLLGLFSEFRFSLVDERDLILSLNERLNNSELIEASAYLKEPWLVNSYSYQEPVRDFLTKIFYESKLTVPRLLGEVFREEDRRMSNVYEGIMRATSDGKNKTTEMADVLYSRRIIPKNDPGYLHTYLKNMINMGLMEKLPVINTNKFLYYHVSPIMDAYYYLDEKYTFSEMDVSQEQIEKVVEILIPRHVEQFYRNLLAKIFGLRKGVAITNDLEVDIVLTDFKKIKVVAEVKWKKSVSRTEISRVEENLNKFDARKILIVPHKQIIEREPEGVEVWDIQRVIKAVKEGKILDN